MHVPALARQVVQADFIADRIILEPVGSLLRQIGFVPIHLAWHLEAILPASLNLCPAP